MELCPFGNLIFNHSGFRLLLQHVILSIFNRTQIYDEVFKYMLIFLIFQVVKFPETPLFFNYMQITENALNKLGKLAFIGIIPYICLQ